MLAAWEAVVARGEKAPPGVVREEILRSWRRCRALGLDPYSAEVAPALSAAELERLRGENQDLLAAAEATLRIIAATARDSGFILTLAELRGYVLEAMGGPGIMEEARRGEYMPGCSRANAEAGTNAIGLCLETGRPAQVAGAEHYRAATHGWACCSAPIFGYRGQICGALTLSGPKERIQPHTLPMIVSAAAAIDAGLREKRTVLEKESLNLALTQILDSMSEGIIAVDEHLSIVHINRAAARMLDVGAREGTQSTLLNIVRSESPPVAALRNNQPFNSIETVFLCPPGERRFLASVERFRQDIRGGKGALIRISESAEMLKLARKLGGNYAKYQFSDIVGSETTLAHQVEIARVAANLDSRVLISGESGTGKELFAQAIHNSSRRCNEPFVAISCAAIPHDLIESELFGYVAGAFTGARRDGMIGKFELANRGSLFLDEIDGMPLDMQSKLLRVLQQSEIMRLGDTRTVLLDVRIIAATSANLLEEVAQNNFRKDLYYRLSVIDIDLPPLRNRQSDLRPLCHHILEKKARVMYLPMPHIADDAWEVISLYPWPGNVRELENSLERAISLCDGGVIRAEHLPQRLCGYLNDHRMDCPAPVSRTRRLTGRDIARALNEASGNATHAAKNLGVSRSTFYRALKKENAPGG